VQKPFQKDLSHLSWDEVYARQELRAGLMTEWMDALGLGAGDRVLEIGAGPGFVSLALAERVGSGGLVYASDRSAEALSHLERVQRKRGIAQIERIVVDAAALDPAHIRATSALVTMVLHHADDPASIVRSVACCLPPNAPVVISEFHPDGPCTGGPPRDHRLSPKTIELWCKEAGLTTVGFRRQTPEHYMLIARRGTSCG
jgi:ubiquinone/menaquinone biosynthesis C-methylase UbiE